MFANIAAVFWSMTKSRLNSVGFKYFNPIPFGMNGNKWLWAVLLGRYLKEWGLFLCVLAICFNPQNTSGQGYSKQAPTVAPVYEELHLLALQDILDFSPSAQERLAILKSRYPNHPANLYLENYKAFIDFMAFEKPVDVETFTVLAERRAALIDKAASGSIASVYKDNMFLQVAVVELVKGQNATALKYVVKASQHVKKIPADNACAQEKEKLTVLFSLFCSNIPDGYQWVLRLMGMPVVQGDVNHRLQKYVVNCSSISGLGYEAVLLQMVAALKLDDSVEKLPILSDRLLGNTMIAYINALLVFKHHAVGDLLPDMPEVACNKFPPLWYARGRFLLNQLSAESGVAFENYLLYFHGASFKTDAMLRLAWLGRLNGQNTNTLEWVELGRKMTRFPNYADRQAVSELSDFDNLNVVLLKARLLFDGGRPDKSLAMLLENGVADKKYSCEYHYRLARAYHELGEADKALGHYRSSIANNSRPSRYFAPNSALMMARIEVARGRNGKAEKLAHEAIALSVGEYAESIKSEAATLIKSLAVGTTK